MKIVNVDIKYALLILLISVIFVFDLFFNVGMYGNGDGLVHTIAPTLFAKSILQGNFPVGWVDGFANYGLPLGTISQQVTTYLTAFLIILSHNTVLAYNIVFFLGIFLSSLFFYTFLRLYFPSLYAFIAVFFFNFTQYRILDVYIRGDVPEIFAEIFFPLILIASYLLITKKNIWGIFLLIISFALLTLTHPFMDIIAMFLLIPYILFLFVSSGKLKIRHIITYSAISLFSILLSIGIAAYYIVPLVLENKYFYYGESANHLANGSYLHIQNFITYIYPYFSQAGILNRGFAVTVGVLESGIFLIGLIYWIYRLFTKKWKNGITLFDFSIVTGLLILFMTSSFSGVIYSHITLISNIQFQWRMLTAFIFIPPLVLASFLHKWKNRYFPFLCVLLIACFAFPQLYGKNFTVYPHNYYSFTPFNIDGVVMNPIWTGKSETYPVVSKKPAIIGGVGKILSQKVTNEKRVYRIFAKGPISMIDRTFYFPGWKVFVDGVAVPIQFQDPNHRGVITYAVPSGTHSVVVTYTDTAVRLLGKILTMVSLVLLIVLVFLRKLLKQLLV